MFRCERRNAFKFYLFTCTKCITDREDTRIEYTDDIARICLLDDLSILRHHLLWLGETDLASALHMRYFHACLKFAGTDTHKCDTVAVRLVHICLNLEDKRAEIRRERIHHAGCRISRQRRGCHFQEMLQECLYTKVCQRRTKEYRG